MEQRVCWVNNQNFSRSSSHTYYCSWQIWNNCSLAHCLQIPSVRCVLTLTRQGTELDSTGTWDFYFLKIWLIRFYLSLDSILVMVGMSDLSLRHYGAQCLQTCWGVSSQPSYARQYILILSIMLIYGYPEISFVAAKTLLALQHCPIDGVGVVRKCRRLQSVA